MQSTLRLILYIGFLFPLYVTAIPYYFNHFQVADGLSNNATLCSVQDHDGFIWFGTRDGLNRFDGYRFHNYYHESSNPKSLGSNLIHSLLITEENKVWVGTDQGIYIYDPRLEEFSQFDKLNKGEILQIAQDQKGIIWFISNSKLYRYDPKRDYLDKSYAEKFKSESHAFVIDHQNQVWLAVQNRVVAIDGNERFSLPRQIVDYGRIEDLFIDKNHNFWIGTSKSGVFHYSKSTGIISNKIKNQNKSPLYVREIEQINDTLLWVASESGLIEYNLKTEDYNFFIHEKDNAWSLSDNAVYSILKDHQQGIWVGTFFGGINYFHPQHNLFQKVFPRDSKNSMSGHAPREIVEDQNGNIWIGTEDEGLTKWDQKTNRFYNFGLESNLSHTNIHGLVMAGDSLLVGTFFQGLNVFDLKREKVIKTFTSASTHQTLPNNFIYCSLKTSTGKILLGTSPGIIEFIPGKDEFKKFTSLPSHIFYTSIFEDRSQRLWLGTWRDGLYMLDQRTGKLSKFLHEPNDPTSLSGNRVNRVFEDSKNNIWVATESGLCRYDLKSDRFRRITTKNGLPSNLILALQEDNRENLWISTTKGLVKMNLNNYLITLFDTEDGLLDLQFNYNSSFKDTNGNLYFGASKGLIKFNPDLFQNTYSTNHQTPIYITRIEANQEDISVQPGKNHLKQSILYTSKIELEHDQSTLGIDFVALNFVSSKSTSYRYRMMGLDTTWVFLQTNTSANFIKLPPGKYTFEVMATDVNQNPISKVKSLEITIHPPIWASIPAYILYFFLFVGAITYIILRYDRKMKEKTRIRLDRIKSHRERELYKTKMDFFMQVTHEIKTPLTLIKAPLEKIMEGKNPEKDQKWLKTIQNNADKLVELADNLLDFRKVESENFSLQLKELRLAPLIKSIIREFDPIIESKNISINTKLDINLTAKIDIEAMYKIINNLLSNAFKYADRFVSISLAESERNSFILEISNDGVLLKHEDIEYIFEPFQRAPQHYRVKGSGLGLALAHSFATLHGGTLSFQTNSENLNIFVLEIPI